MVDRVLAQSNRILSLSEDEYQPPETAVPPPFSFDDFLVALPGISSKQEKEHSKNEEHIDTTSTTTSNSVHVPLFGVDARSHPLLWNHLDKSTQHLNPGGNGGSSGYTLLRQQYWRNLREANPSHWSFAECPLALMHTTRDLAKFINAKPTNLVFVPNVTAGINSVVRHVMMGGRLRKVLMTSLVYGSNVYITTHWGGGNLNGTNGGHNPVVMLPISAPDAVTQPPDHPKSLASRIRSALEEDEDIHLVIVSHITSGTAVEMPVRDAIKVVHEMGRLILIDGAHAVGQLDLNMEELGADFYTSNCHKWLFTPPPCAFLYVRDVKTHVVHPTIISWGYGLGGADDNRMHGGFHFTGTWDWTAYLSTSASIELIQQYYGGLEVMQRRNCALKVEAVQLLAKKWGWPLFDEDADCDNGGDEVAGATDRITIVPLQYTPPNMCVVRLPSFLQNDAYYDGWEVMSRWLFVARGIETKTSLFERGDVGVATRDGGTGDERSLWIRLTVQVYTELSDVEMLADAVLSLKDVVWSDVIEKYEWPSDNRER